MTMTLTEAIKAVAPHASKDKTLPQLTNVRIVNGKVYATDRYTLALVTNPELLNPATDVLLSPEDVKNGVVSIFTDENGSTLTFANGSTKAATVPVAGETDYPDIEKLAQRMNENIEEAVAERYGIVNIRQFAVNMDYLARFHGKHVKGSGRYRGTPNPIFTLGANATKPIRATFPDYPEYIGFIGPIRIASL
jgi:hypothetical protein